MNNRSAGILMHITSLPSPFGIGDFGKAAYDFVNFLHQTGQTYWQLLPLNPVNKQQAFSPYSSYSAFAGNTLLISPEQLAKDELLTISELSESKIPESDKVNFSVAAELKQHLLNIAFERYKNGKRTDIEKAFRLFCAEEAYWLDDFSLYIILKKKFNGQPWYAWPEAYKKRNPQALTETLQSYQNEMEKIKWEQMIFFQQWNQLKEFCEKSEIRLFGDLPFYVAHDSADVWAHPDIFSLDENGDIQLMAGTPPDQFNENGQLWGMPVFKWDKLSTRRYDWWIKRLHKNLQLFHLLRLDHFRAFSEYWAVPKGEKTAVNGTWKQGPGVDFFYGLKKKFNNLPFVAEDLGTVDEEVFKLRDEFNLPGMNVLHFAFGDNMATNTYIPHMHRATDIVYSGTHDNNTTLGWFNEISRQELKNLNDYTGLRVTERNVVEILLRMAYASVSHIAIIPLQDVLNLDEKSRMNKPASTWENWSWQLRNMGPLEKAAIWLKKWCRLYNRFK